MHRICTFYRPHRHPSITLSRRLAATLCRFCTAGVALLRGEDVDNITMIFNSSNNFGQNRAVTGNTFVLPSFGPCPEMHYHNRGAERRQHRQDRRLTIHSWGISWGRRPADWLVGCASPTQLNLLGVGEGVRGRVGVSGTGVSGTGILPVKK